MNVSGAARRHRRALLIASCVAGLAGCTKNSLIRTDVSACQVDSRAPEKSLSCAESSLEDVMVEAKTSDGTLKTGSYLLGFAEFDDEGKTWEPRQERLIFDRMKSESRTQDLSIIVFVHGWTHNVTETDANVEAFKGLLKAVTSAELQPTDTQPRKVIGIYVGWRGETGPSGLLDNLTFWARKAAAQRVALGSVRGLLGKVRAFHDTLNGTALGPGRHGTRMLTIGHSFGGLIVYSALAQYFVDRAAASIINAEYFQDTPNRGPSVALRDDPRRIPSYGDMVVLINPAIEAMRYEPIRELVAEQHASHPGQQSYARFQMPVMVEVTSVGEGRFDGDWATGLAFPAGRWINTILEATHGDEEQEITKTIGQYPPFWTHDLNISAADADKVAHASDQVVLNQKQECEDIAGFELQRKDGYLASGWRRQFRTGAVLQQNVVLADDLLLQNNKGGRYDPNNPFWIIRAHPRVMKDHGDILNPVLKSFLTQLYQDVSLMRDGKCNAAIDRANSNLR